MANYICCENENNWIIFYDTESGRNYYSCEECGDFIKWDGKLKEGEEF